jgi:hypothetical protein
VFLIDILRQRAGRSLKHRRQLIDTDAVMLRAVSGHPHPQTWNDIEQTMKTPLNILIAVLMIAAASTFARAAGIDGKWAAEFDTQVGVQKYVYEFKTGKDGTITATAQWERMGQTGKTQLKDVKLDGDAISFVETFSIPDGDSEIRIEYKGTLAGDELKLTRKVGDFATEELVAKRIGSHVGAVPPEPKAPAGNRPH